SRGAEVDPVGSPPAPLRGGDLRGGARRDASPLARLAGRTSEDFRDRAIELGHARRRGLRGRDRDRLSARVSRRMEHQRRIARRQRRRRAAPDPDGSAPLPRAALGGQRRRDRSLPDRPRAGVAEVAYKHFVRRAALPRVSWYGPRTSPVSVSVTFSVIVVPSVEPE